MGSNIREHLIVEGVLGEDVPFTATRYSHPPILRCMCGAAVELLDCMTNACDRCGQEYNGSGQALASRECWGEETGEHPSDVTRPMTEQEW